MGAHSSNHKLAGKHGVGKPIDIETTTRFQKVRENVTSSETRHYYSADVTEEKDYHDVMLQDEPYRSTIVIPLRCISKDAPFFIGFFKIQTLKAHSLNDDWHVELFAGFADELFLFLEATRVLRSAPQIPLAI